jgi:hypothetical protein
MLALLHFAASIGAAASWVLVFVAAVVAVFVVYLGIAMYAVYQAKDPDQQKLRYKVFEDLLRVFSGWWRR